jgi:hypothetical protein
MTCASVMCRSRQGARERNLRATGTAGVRSEPGNRPKTDKG